MTEKTYEQRRKEIFETYKIRLQALGFNDPGYPALWDERTLALMLLREEFGINP